VHLRDGARLLARWSRAGFARRKVTYRSKISEEQGKGKIKPEEKER
jgi:hypothetical protein